MGMSQEDIDKIAEEGPPQEEAGDNSDAVRQKYREAFKSHLENIFGTLTGEEFKVEVGEEGISPADDLPKTFEGEWFGFTGSLDIGQVVVTGHLMSMAVAKYVVGKIMGQDAPEALEEAHLGALKEAANNLLGAWATGLGELLSSETKPAGEVGLFEGDGAASLASAEGITGEEVTSWRYSISVGEIEGQYVLVIPTKNVKELVMAHPEYAASAPAEAAEAEPQAPDTETAAEETAIAEKAEAKPEVEVEKAVFQEFEGEAPTGAPSPIQLLLDVPLTVSVELGRKRLCIKEILDMIPGSLLELDKLAGEPVDLMVNGKLFARGEVVVIDENFGVRIANIVSPKERLERLK